MTLLACRYWMEMTCKASMHRWAIHAVRQESREAADSGQLLEGAGALVLDGDNL